MTPSAKSPIPGVLIYGDSGITTSLLVSGAIALATLLLGAIFLRARAGSEAGDEQVTSAQETALSA